MNLKVAFDGTYTGYEHSFLPSLLGTLTKSINFVSPDKCDLLIQGPFTKNEKRYRWLPKSMRANFELPVWGKRMKPLILFHTNENTRVDFSKVDYGIGFDFIYGNNNFFRFPYWMEMLDWSDNGFRGNSNPRYGSLININKLMRPIGLDEWFTRKPIAAFFTSHMIEPRLSLYKKISESIPIDGYGPFFNEEIKNHNSSKYKKKDVLGMYQFNLCPENNCYPGYYTEKIPEAFHSGCIPITCVDSNVSFDFNPKAFINLFDEFGGGFGDFSHLLSNKLYVKSKLTEPLILRRPCLEPLRFFLEKMLLDLND